MLFPSLSDPATSHYSSTAPSLLHHTYQIDESANVFKQVTHVSDRMDRPPILSRVYGLF